MPISIKIGKNQNNQYITKINLLDKWSINRNRNTLCHCSLSTEEGCVAGRVTDSKAEPWEGCFCSFSKRPAPTLHQAFSPNTGLIKYTQTPSSVLPPWKVIDMNQTCRHLILSVYAANMNKQFENDKPHTRDVWQAVPGNKTHLCHKMTEFYTEMIR